MQRKSAIVLRALLQHYHPAGWEEYLSPLQSEEAELVKQWKLNEIASNSLRPETLFHSIHYSWLKPILEREPDSLKPLLLATLPIPMQNRLESLLKTAPAPSPPGLLKKWLMQRLYNAFTAPEALPTALLSVSSPLQPLAILQKEELIEVIDLFSLYDLAKEIRTVVDKQKLKSFYTCLTARERRFLRRCLQIKELLTTTKWQLDHWDGDCNKLHKLMHYKGLLRLGHALSGQEPELIWTITHKLDKGRAKAIQKYISKQLPTHVTEELVQQLIGLLRFFHKERTAV